MAELAASPKLPRLLHRRRPLSPPGCSLGSQTLGPAGSAPGAEQGTKWVGVGAGPGERRSQGRARSGGRSRMRGGPRGGAAGAGVGLQHVGGRWQGWPRRLELWSPRLGPLSAPGPHRLHRPPPATTDRRTTRPLLPAPRRAHDHPVPFGCARPPQVL